MATVQVFTAARSQEIEDNTIVSGLIVGDDLILTRNDSTTVNAGNVRGPIGPTGSVFPAGTPLMWLFPTLPSGGWIWIEGQSILNCDTTYPNLWAAAPAGWKSGTTLIMPNMRGKMPIMQDTGQTEFDALLETGGSKTTTLTATNLPAHQHAIDHDHPSVTITMGGAPVGGAENVVSGASPINAAGIASPSPSVPFEANVAPFTGLSGTGSGLNATPFTNMPPYIVVNFIMKT